MNIEHIINIKDNAYNDVALVYDEYNAHLASIPIRNKLQSEENKFPNHLVENVKFIEDRSFDSHFGFSFKSLLRAFYINIRSGRIRQGGSTIAQQLIRTLLPLKNRYLRKFIEIVLAPVATIINGRKWVINSYLENVFLGNNLSGFQAASKLYLKKNVNNTSDLESLVLASYLSKPNFWLKHPEKISQKINYLLIRRDKNIYSMRQILKVTKRISKNYSKNCQPDWFPKFSNYIRKVYSADKKVILSVKTELQKHLDKKFKIKAKNTAILVIDHKTFSVKCI